MEFGYAVLIIPHFHRFLNDSTKTVIELLPVCRILSNESIENRSVACPSQGVFLYFRKHRMPNYAYPYNSAGVQPTM